MKFFKRIGDAISSVLEAFTKTNTKKHFPDNNVTGYALEGSSTREYQLRTAIMPKKPEMSQKDLGFDRADAWLSEDRKTEIFVNFILEWFKNRNIRNCSIDGKCEEIVREYWGQNNFIIWEAFFQDNRLALSTEAKKLAFEKALYRHCPSINLTVVK